MIQILGSSPDKIPEFCWAEKSKIILAISEIERTQTPGSPVQDAMPPHFTPKAKESLKQGKKLEDHWNKAAMEMDRKLTAYLLVSENC